MGKKRSRAASSSAPEPSKKAKPTNEIDSIFLGTTSSSSSKPEASKAAGEPTLGALAESSNSKKRKKSNKKKAKPETLTAPANAEAGNDAAVGEAQEVEDPSVALLSEVKKQKTAQESKKKHKPADGANQEGNAAEEGHGLDDGDADLFDSRGSKRRRTDDGLPIYTVQELNIGHGGDTPQCPFDCDCCY